MKRQQVNTYIFITSETKVYVSRGKTQQEAYLNLLDWLVVDSLEIKQTYKATEEVQYDVPCTI